MKIKILLLASVLTACQAAAPTPQADPKRVWQPVSLNGFDAAQLQHATMDWTRLPQASANMGCNNIGFQAALDGSGNATISPPFATRMYCEGAMRLESAFSQNIAKMRRYRIERGTLILDDGAGNEMRFTAKP